MEKDWSSRFEVSNLENNRRRTFYGCVLMMMIVLVLLSTGWAILEIEVGFHDSMGRPRNPDLNGHIRVYTRALTPLIISVALAYAGWTRRNKLKPNTGNKC